MTEPPVHRNPSPGRDEDIHLAATQAGMDATFRVTRSLESDLLGLSETEALALATSHGIELRVIRHDRTPLTLDIRPTRMTIDLRSGRVTTAKAG